VLPWPPANFDRPVPSTVDVAWRKREEERECVCERERKKKREKERK
jgi:hypothetical protein